MLNMNADLIFEFPLGLVQAMFEQLMNKKNFFNAYLIQV